MNIVHAFKGQHSTRVIFAEKRTLIDINSVHMGHHNIYYTVRVGHILGTVQLADFSLLAIKEP